MKLLQKSGYQNSACACDDGCCGRSGKAYRYARLAAGAVVFAAGICFDFPAQAAELVIFAAAYLLIGADVLAAAFKNILKGRVFDENFLMGIASLGAFAIGQYSEGVAVMLFYQVGEALQDRAVDHSKKSISSLVKMRPDFANLKTDGGIKRVDPESVNVGDIIVVKPGERVPLDGRVVEGASTLDTSALTGESLPREAAPGNAVLSGSVNQSGLLTLEVTSKFSESTVAKIMALVQSASKNKAPTENFITKFAARYTPFVVFAALALAVVPPLVLGVETFPVWIHRALVFLVVSCPCALVISIPLSFLAGIGGASKKGILVKGGNYLDALADADTVIFDKTGTLTKGSLTVHSVACAPGISQDELLMYASHAESHSSHPIAVCVRAAYPGTVDAGRISGYEEIAGRGIRARLDGKTVLAGSRALMADENVAIPGSISGETGIYIAIDGKYAGHISVSDETRPDSAQAVRALRAEGVGHIAMLTGDSMAAGERVARELGLDEVHAELLPHQKVQRLDEIQKRRTGRGKLVFVGDGINDAPVLARSDIGVAMGGLGSDAAIEAAGVVIMTDEPSKLAVAVKTAKKTRSIVWQNIIFALSVKAVILILGALGIATMWEAVFGDVGVALIAILNATRAMKSIA